MIMNPIHNVRGNMSFMCASRNHSHGADGWIHPCLNWPSVSFYAKNDGI